MRFRKYSRKALWLVLLCLSPAIASAGSKNGISQEALDELADAGVNKYLGQFQPSSSEPWEDGWTRHNFDSDGGNGPICIDGSSYSMFTRKGKEPRKLLIMLQGGGACWQGLSACSETIENQVPRGQRSGIWDLEDERNPFRNYSVAYLPYCDGSVFVGDNTVIDPEFDAQTGTDGVRHHRGLRNLSAGMDVARAEFRKAKRITVAGSSAGGVGAVAFAPSLVRFLYGNRIKDLTVFNDAGPIALNPDALDAIAARDNDWQFGSFYPASCTTCSAYGDQTEIIKWRLENDRGIREVFYETDGDETNIGFASVNLPGFFDPLPPIIPFPAGLSQLEYRELVLRAHQQIVDAFPDRYRRFIVSGDASHTALQTDLFYTQQIRGIYLHRWTTDFIRGKKSWWDLVDDFEPLPE